ncbi:MAG: hypothetical protein KKE86_08205 [Planctomycetes bacterium]|nr:hypothetical protein [Planctomycetota bacterium]MBU4399302.1 hypothetical protein [Planctomycetota bacterium]
MDIRRLVALNRQRILDTAARHGASSGRVFGSVARNETEPADDIDFLIQGGKRCHP